MHFAKSLHCIKTCLIVQRNWFNSISSYTRLLLLYESCNSANRVSSCLSSCRLAGHPNLLRGSLFKRYTHSEQGDPHGLGKLKQIEKRKSVRRQELLERQQLKQDAQKLKNPTTYELATEPGEKKVTSCPLPKAYSPAYVEAAWYSWWEKQGFFQPKEGSKAAFVVCLPPPNVTGTLHLGHALGCSIQDALIRWHRMRGVPTLWLPGCDHAGIATQVVVEKQLWREQQKTRHDIGRQAFTEQVWNWKQQKGDRIFEQMKKLGCSLDWSRQVFTLDQKMSTAVDEAFIRLHDEGLIYRDTRLVNWCCALKSSISDIEVENQPLEKKTYLSIPGYEKKVPFGVMTSFAYPVDGSDGELVVSTTRPETMLGDVAVAVHPEDTRYQHLHGKRLKHPFCSSTLPVVTDFSVDRNFGTGAVKITPSHDANDNELGRRHGLPSMSVIDEDGCMVQVPDPFQGMKRFDARRAVVDALRERGLLRDEQDHAMSLPICSRTGDVVEPMLKEQWFLNCSQMAQQASQVVKSGQLELIPEIYNKVWHAWLNNIRDWCISRQLWWGHQIPAYKATAHTSQGEVWVSGHTEEEVRSKASSLLRCPASQIHLHRDPDVLDTWFSSALFPFSSLGWPNMSGDYAEFYPTSLLETGGDILFFWVARMVMLGQHLTGQLPFKQVLLHGLLRDSHGRKMSKSLGNVIDPMDVISGISLKDLQRQVEQSNLSAAEVQKAQVGQKKDFPLGIAECGADSLRFALCSYQYKAHVLNVDVSHIKSYRNFCNKIWQAFRFSQSHWTQEHYSPLTEEQMSHCSATDQWILSRLSHVVETCDQAFRDYSLNQATQALHHFWVQDFCDVYVEYAKTVFQRKEPDRVALVESILYQCVSTMLRCVSPFMPYLSEELYQRLPSPRADSVCVAPYPRPQDYPWRAEHVEQDMTCVQEIISELLALRKDLKLTKVKPRVWLESTDYIEFEALVDHLQALTVLSRSSELHVTMEAADRLNKDSCIEIDVSETCKAYIELEGLLDVDQTLKVLDQQLAALESEQEELQAEASLEQDEQSKDDDGHR